MKGILFIVLLLFARPGFAADPWTDAQVGQQVAVTILFVADWGQTRDIKNHPELYEGNSILGSHPSDSKIDRYFATVTAGHALVSHWLPSRRIASWLPDITWRDAWQHVWIAREAVSIENNYSLGVKFDF